MKKLLILLMLLCATTFAQTNGQRAQVQMRYVTALPATCVPNQAVIYAVIGSLPIHYWVCSTTNTFVDLTDSGSTPALTATQIGFGSAGNILSGSTRLTWDNTNRTATLGEAANSGQVNIQLRSTSSSSALLTHSSAIRSGSQQGGIIFPNVGGDQTQGPGLTWSDGNYNATSRLYLSLGLNWQGYDTGGQALRLRKTTATSSQGDVVFEFRPNDGYAQHAPFGTSAGNTATSRYLELAANGSNYFEVGAADAITTNYKMTWPTDAPVANDFLKVTGLSGGVISTEWAVPSGGAASAGGSDTEVQRNNGGALGGITGVTSDGTNMTAGSGNFRATSPRVTTQISDANGNAMLAFSPTASAVNYFRFTNSATATTPINILESLGSDSNASIHIKAKTGTYPNNGQVFFNASARYDRPSIAFYDENSTTYIPTVGIGMKSGGSWLSLIAPNIMLGAGDGTPGYVGITGNSYVAFNTNNTAAEDCPACVAVGIHKYSSRVIGFVGADSTPDGDLTHGATIGFVPNTPAQITASQNNYDPGDPSYYQRWSTDASRQVTGMTFAVSPKVNGQMHQIWNVDSNDLILVHESISSTSTNRFITTDGINITLTAGQCANVIYDASLASARWRASKCEGSGSGSGVTAIGTLDSQSKSADGAVVSGSDLVLQTADGTNPGLVSTGTQTLAGSKTFSSAPSAPVTGNANSERWGAGSTASANGTAVGQGSNAGSSGTSLGRGTNSGASGIAIGINSNAAANEFVAGDDGGAEITSVYFGSGKAQTAIPTAYTIRGSSPSAGSNRSGANLSLASGQGTGNSTVSDLIFLTPTAGASGSSNQTMTARLTINESNSTFTNNVAGTTANFSGAITVGSCTGCGTGANPAGSGSEIQARSSGSAFQAVTGSSISGGQITLVDTAAINIDNADTNTISNHLNIGHSSTGTVAAGFGAGLSFNLESSTTVGRNSGQITSFWNDVTDATRRSTMNFTVTGNAQVTNALQLRAPNATGNNYFVMTPAAAGANPTLSVDGDTNTNIAISPKGTGATIIANGNLNFGGTASSNLMFKPDGTTGGSFRRGDDSNLSGEIFGGTFVAGSGGARKALIDAGNTVVGMSLASDGTFYFSSNTNATAGINVLSLLRESGSILKVGQGTTAGYGDLKARHLLTATASNAPTIGSGFGTSPTIAGGDDGGRITVGTGGVATTGVINFGVAYGTAPACVANNETTIQLVQATATTTTLTITAAAAFGAGDKLTWVCRGW